jgi:hypothetical protein
MSNRQLGADPAGARDGAPWGIPVLGHLPLSMISAGLVDRAIDDWEQHYGRSTVKNTVAALVLVLDEAFVTGSSPATLRKTETGAGPWPAPPSTRSPRVLGTLRSPTSLPWSGSWGAWSRPAAIRRTAMS